MFKVGDRELLRTKGLLDAAGTGKSQPPFGRRSQLGMATVTSVTRATAQDALQRNIRCSLTTRINAYQRKTCFESPSPRQCLT